MTREDIILTSIPLLLTVLIIFGHYQFLRSQNPEAHKNIILSEGGVEPIGSEDLKPFSPKSSLSKRITGVAHEIPTSTKQLRELFSLIESQQANLLLLTVNLGFDKEGNLVIPKAVASSEEMIIRWVKKTISDAHRLGIHTYISFLIMNGQEIKDEKIYFQELSGYIKRWGSMAQEYDVSFFDPGITVGHPSFIKLETDDMQNLILQTEHKLREVYTGRIGLSYCCQISDVIPRGYNQILMIENKGKVNQSLKDQVIADSQAFNVEHIFLLDLESQRITTLK